MKKKNTEKWSENEIKVIMDPDITHNEAAFRIGRTYSAVKAKRLKLKVAVNNKDVDYYSPEVIKVMVANRHLSNPEMAKMLGRTTHAISLKRQRLGIAPPSNEWDSEEIEYLVENYYEKSKKTISNHLGRSVSSVLTKAYEIGITKKTEYWTHQEVAILKENFDKNNEAISRLISKNEAQIAYKKAYLNSLKKRDLSNVSGLDSHVPFLPKSKQSQYLTVLMAMEVNQSFVYPANENQHVVMAKAYIKERVFKTKKEDELSRRIWRLT